MDYSPKPKTQSYQTLTASVGRNHKKENRETDFIFNADYFDRFFTKPEKFKQLCFEWFHSVRMTIKQRVKKLFKRVKIKVKQVILSGQLEIIFNSNL
jgi:hypothetical protein